MYIPINARVVRITSYIVVIALLLVLGAGFFANSQTVRAGGIPQPLYQLLSDKYAANANYTIHTAVLVGGLDTYVVRPAAANADYNLAALGTDYVCIHKVGTAAARMVCIPYSAIATINF